MNNPEIDDPQPPVNVRAHDDDMAGDISPHIVMSLAKYDDGDYVTKAGLSKSFGCSERTLLRMVERFDLPPPIMLAGKKVWIVGKIRAWIATAVERREKEALKAAARLRVFET